ncbi:LOW QUALITY PROTEIN: hypothetical protein BU14_0453s0011 [Porphyra umbilicalis]|uniref:Uncharacterized protein n=1 Tax=Porphyra umbilicalis TaxID=2786 RepID=A0A1X6NUR9_PORUM|nr:LOW QUALITY PROTEIN: hypothetical protein BU14_0453s0011 [Porphyra umbilicalis]|eukprot:OSX72246.1 LOW QUALITY PROTEIN: hypothetical protein BU14_0453s0011 [Porphyra umbilicalis]
MRSNKRKQKHGDERKQERLHHVESRAKENGCTSFVILQQRSSIFRSPNAATPRIDALADVSLTVCSASRPLPPPLRRPISPNSCFPPPQHRRRDPACPHLPFPAPTIVAVLPPPDGVVPLLWRRQRYVDYFLLSPTSMVWPRSASAPPLLFPMPSSKRTCSARRRGRPHVAPGPLPRPRAAVVARRRHSSTQTRLRRRPMQRRPRCGRQSGGGDCERLRRRRRRKHRCALAATGGLGSRAYRRHVPPPLQCIAPTAKLAADATRAAAAGGGRRVIVVAARQSGGGGATTGRAARSRDAPCLPPRAWPGGGRGEATIGGACGVSSDGTSLSGAPCAAGRGCNGGGSVRFGGGNSCGDGCVSAGQSHACMHAWDTGACVRDLHSQP